MADSERPLRKIIHVDMLIFVKTRFEIYRAVSQQIRQIFLDYTDLVEPIEPR